MRFWGKLGLTLKNHAAFSLRDCGCQHRGGGGGGFLSQGATLQTRPSGYQQTHQVNPQSSEELALVCLQVLADLRNVQDNYYRTQKRPAQPSHIWKEGSGHTKESETDLLLPLNSQTRGRLEPSSSPFVKGPSSNREHL